MKIFKNILFWLWSCTYGCVMTLFGALMALGCLITGHRPHLFNGRVYFMIVNNTWGGLEAGPFFFTDKSPSLRLKQHECGHGIQNLYLGPLFPFIVGIRSAARYWLREFGTYKTRSVYCGIITLIACVLSGGLITLAGFLGILWLYIVVAVIVVYLIWITVWLWLENDKHKDKFPMYDAFFWEGNADRVGAKLFPTDNHLNK